MACTFKVKTVLEGPCAQPVGVAHAKALGFVARGRRPQSQEMRTCYLH